MLDIFAKVGLINCIVAIFLIIQILLKGKKDFQNWSFIVLASSIALWSFGYWQWLSSATPDRADFWVKIFTVGSTLIPLTYFFWASVLLGEIKKYITHLIGLSLISILLIYDTFATSLIIKGLGPKSVFPFWPQPGALYLWYILVLYFGAVGSSLLLQFRSYRNTKDQNLKNQVKYIFWGSVVGFGGGLTNFFLWYNISIPPYFNFLVGVGLILFYYAASKHSLFNIKVIATEFLAYVLWIGILARFLLATTTQDRVIDGITLIFLLIIGQRLIRSVRVEVEQREQLEKLDKELEAANAQLKVLDQARAEFISIASHQLRTPPATIKWYLAAVLTGDFGPISDQVRKALGNAEMTNNSLISLIDDLLNASRIERGKLEFIFEPTDIVKITKFTVDQLTPQALQKKQQLIFIAPKTEIPQVTADKEKIRQVVNNFIDNSIKYTPQGGKIEVSVTKTAKDAVIKVKDNGKGISKENLKSVFEKYNRGGNKSDSQGLGLGLYVAKVVVEEHNGKIWVESPGEGKGSTFCISLPLKSTLKVATFDLTKEQTTVKSKI